MPQYVIERTLAGAGRLSSAELRGISQKSVSVIRELGAADVQWVQSYVTGDKIYCVYNAKNPDIVFEHARCGGFPADCVAEVKTIISPITAE
jgi:hypothetical protein